MLRVLLLPVFVAALGCASKTASQSASTSATVEESAPKGSDAEPAAESQILEKRFSKTKCAKNAKLVNGKCVLQVESND